MPFRLALALLFVLLLASHAAAQDEKKRPRSVAEATRGMAKIDGFIPLYWDEERGRMLLEIPLLDREFLYQVSLTTGVGSNPIGLDRGQLGDTQVVSFRRVGTKVLMVASNYRFRALSGNAAEHRAVDESFAPSVIWGFPVVFFKRDRVDEEEGSFLPGVLVDATAFFLRDAHGVAERLRAAEQGRFSVDESRSAYYLPATKGFPDNTEVETMLTFVSDDPGRLVRETIPAPRALTVRQRHSFVELPDDKYRPRKLDPRVGVFAVDFYDYATPVSEPLEKHWIVRHRLEKKDPAAAVSEPVRPIVYYVDAGTPEPIRSALVEGAAWWNEAFAAAGFRDAFQVKLLPPGADPMDVRYNMINWVHRSTRGWAYGSTVVDPRTGEIVRGVVTLDSQRARQDFLLGTGLVPAYVSHKRGAAACDFALLPDAGYLAETPADLTAMSIARIRQLSAHEVGHTLGLAHNFAASTYGRASVMDYPAPLVEIREGRLDLSQAYAVGVGAYDKFAVRYAYAQFAPGANEEAELSRLVREGVAAGMLFISDADARPPGAAHPLANLWDNGDDPVRMLRHEMEVRRIGLAQFGLANLPEGAPLSQLEAKFLPLYLHHRYQLTAAAKSLGGVYYTYAVREAGGVSPARVVEVVPAARQREALAALLSTLKVEELRVPPRLLALVPPRAFGHEAGTAELFEKRTAPVFDPVGAATIAADLTLAELLQPQRAARLVEHHARDYASPSFWHVLDGLLNATWPRTPPPDKADMAVALAVQSLVVNRLMELAANPDAAPQVRGEATAALRVLHDRIAHNGYSSWPPNHLAATSEEIERFLARPHEPRRRTQPLPRPPGDPIGSAQTVP